MSQYAYLILPDSIAVNINGKAYTVNKGNTAYAKVKELIHAGKFEEIPDTIDRMAAITNKVAAKKDGFDSVVIRERRVYLKNPDGTEQRLVGYEIERLLALMDEGFDIKPLMNFVVRIRQNPSEAVRQRLYAFMEYGQLPLCPDGRFLTYKVVRNDFKDKHSGKFDNSPGQIVEMDRAGVNDDDNQTCSTGLHVCSKEYVRSFLPGKLVTCAVAPEDVVSIPVDYNNTKMRTCRYEVLAEISAIDDPAFFGKSVYNAPTPVADQDDDTGVQYW